MRVRVAGDDAVAVTTSNAAPRAVFLVECYAPESDPDASRAMADGAARACARLHKAGADVRYLGAVVVPGDEIGFHLFAAADVDGVLEAAQRAALRVERVVEALAIAVEGDRPVAHAPGEIGP